MSEFNSVLFANHIREKRAGRSLRDVQDECGLSVATINRAENHKIPDVMTFAKLCKWMGKDPAIYLAQPDSNVIVSLKLELDRNKDQRLVLTDASGKEWSLSNRTVCAEGGGVVSIEPKSECFYFQQL